MSQGDYRLNAILTLLFVSSVMPGCPDSNRMIVRDEMPAFRANSSFRKPNLTRRFFHAFALVMIKRYDSDVVTSMYKN